MLEGLKSWWCRHASLKISVLSFSSSVRGFSDAGAERAEAGGIGEGIARGVKTCL